MSTRPSVNKRQREALRKERQAEKALRRDQRRAGIKLPGEDESLAEPAADIAESPAEPGAAAPEPSPAAGSPPLAE